MAQDRRNLQEAWKAEEVPRQEKNSEEREAGERSSESQENDGGKVRKKEVRPPRVLKEPNEG